MITFQVKWTNKHTGQVVLTCSTQADKEKPLQDFLDARDDLLFEAIDQLQALGYGREHLICESRFLGE